MGFYEPVLASIGIVKMLEIPTLKEGTQPAMTAFGLAGVKPYFWLVDSGTVGTNMHLAFTVDTRDEVHTFFDAALAAGATSLHPPGVFTEYHDYYDGGFVTDTLGINLEAVCHRQLTPREG